MDKNNAINLIQETFNYPFNEENYLKFSKNLIDDIKVNSNLGWVKNHNLPSTIKSKVVKFKTIGNHEYKNDEQIAIVMVQLISKDIVTKSRYLQRDFAKWYLEKNDLDAILVSFFADDYEDWRFSLIKKDYKREITKSGQLKITQELTPIRRYSYLVGKNEPNHTAKAQLSPLLLDDAKNPSIDNLIDAFSVANVTKDFYKDYTTVFYEFEKYIHENFSLTVKEVRSFTQSLFNRLMFTRFIEKKDWLTFNNSKMYLYELFKAGDFNEKSFYNGRLKELFFEGFSVEEINHNEAYGKVNFFGGELFDLTDLDKKITDIPNNLFSKILSDDGLFYKYNFTVEESTPLETQVSIDPEMLGKVFEELVTGRNDSGSFYTPKNVVDYMCKKSLISYFNDENFILNENFDKSKKRDYLKILQNLKILDPACGSGAYLLGILDELIRLYQILDNKKDDELDKYKLKLSIIQNNIYGVDLDGVAIQIAKLRLWLTLVVEYEGTKPEPLPNLNFKIEEGNSLSTNLLENSAPDLFLEQIIYKFDQLKSEYQFAKRRNKKERLTKEINNLKEEIKNSLFGKHFKENFFEWRLEFAEIFLNQDNSGFDIILCNPPYIRHEDIAHLKNVLEKNFSLYSSTSDLYIYFFELASKILKKNGILTFITSNKWMRVQYGKKLRKHILDNLSIINLIDFKGKQIFSSATVDTSIIMLKNLIPNQNNKFLYSNDIIYEEKVLSKFFQKNLSDESFIFLKNDEINLKEKIIKIGKPIKNWDVDIFRGITTGYNKAFYIDKKIRDELIKQNNDNKNIIKTSLKGKDIGNYSITEPSNYLLFIPWHFPNHESSFSNFEKNEKDFKKKFPEIYNHLTKYKKHLINRNKSETGIRYEWYALQRCAAKYYNKFFEKKIIWSEIVQYPQFYLNKNNIFIDASAFMMTGKDLEYILGFLNAKTFTYIFKNFFAGGSLGQKGFRYKKVYLEKVPIPLTSDVNKKIIVDNVNFILDSNNKKIENNEKIIISKKIIEDKIQEIYQLNENEKKLISEFDI